MYKYVILFIVVSIAFSFFYSQMKGQSVKKEKEQFQSLSFKLADTKADSLLTLMTQDEIISLVEGDRSFFIRPFPRLNLPEVYMTDATGGVHIR